MTERERWYDARLELLRQANFFSARVVSRLAEHIRLAVRLADEAMDKRLPDGLEVEPDGAP